MNAPAAIMIARMKPLPRHHRIAHLRALMRSQLSGSLRRRELAALLRDATAAAEMGPRRMNRPWMPLYVGDYLGDTGHLTTTQHGAYFLLMMHYWRKGELPDDDRQLSKITKLPLRTWREYRPTLQDSSTRLEAQADRRRTG